MNPDRRRRDIFSNLGALHSLARLEDLDVEDVTDRKKRSGFTDGLLKAREKLLDGSPGGFFVEMLKTIAKPVYNWVIGTDNDEVMKKFTTRMLPETQFRGHPEEYKIASHADEGDGAAVWTTLSQNSLKWNPEQNFEDDSNKIHLQCRRNVKLIDEAFKERLKSVSLVVTSLLTSLHDTSMEGMNKGFKMASDKFEKKSSIPVRKSSEVLTP